MGVDQDDNWLPMVRKSFEDVKKDEITGIPFNPTLFGTYRPHFFAIASGPNIQLGVVFSAGQLWDRSLGTGLMKPGVDITGWTFNMPIRVDFAEFSTTPKGAASKVVQDRLERFSSEGFAVSQLFCDLQSVDLLGTSSTINTGSNTNGSVKKMFRAFMLDGYLDFIQNHPETNPYIFGYVAKVPTGSAASQDINVPDSLRPVGNTFNVFFDSNDLSRSTLNFILSTADSLIPAGTHPSTDIFDENWISPTEVCDGKMIYSFRAFMETLVLKEFYETYMSSMHRQISEGGIIIGRSNSYEQARKPGTYHFDVHNEISTEDQYVSSFDVSWNNTTIGFSIDITGSIYWYKEKHKNVVIATKPEKARAWVGCTTNWTTTINISLGVDALSNPVLEMPAPQLQVTSSKPFKDANGVAKTLSRWEDMLGTLLDVGGILFIFDPAQWLAAGLLSLSLIKFPSKVTAAGVQLDLTLESLPKTAATTICLAAGDVFEYQNVRVIPETGATSMLVTYKPEK